MRRALLLVVLVTAVTAGCTGTPASPNGAATDGGTTTGTTQVAQFGPAAINDSVYARHVAALRAAGSFRVDGTMERPNQDVDLRGAVDVNAGTALTTTGLPDRTSRTFVNESGQYQRVVADGETRYVTRGPIGIEQLFLGRYVPVDASYERTGTATVNGTPVATYRTESLPESFGPIDPEENSMATLSVAESGVIRRVQWSAVDASGDRIRFDMTFTDVGTAAVEKPDWVSKAAAAPPESAPEVAFQFEYDGNGTVTVTHTGGDTVEAENLDVEVTPSGENESVAYAWNGGSEVSAGERMRVKASAGATVRVVWSAGGQSTVLGEYAVP